MKINKYKQTIQKRIAKWETPTIRETITNHNRDIKSYGKDLRDSHYARLVANVKILNEELASR